MIVMEFPVPAKRASPDCEPCTIKQMTIEREAAGLVDLTLNGHKSFGGRVFCKFGTRLRSWQRSLEECLVHANPCNMLRKALLLRSPPKP